MRGFIVYPSGYWQAIGGNRVEEPAAGKKKIVGSGFLEYVAASQAVGCHHHPLERPVFTDRLPTEGGASRIEAAALALYGRYPVPVHVDSSEQYQLDSRCFRTGTVGVVTVIHCPSPFHRRFGAEGGHCGDEQAPDCQNEHGPTHSPSGFPPVWNRLQASITCRWQGIGE
jgi:hypothetical protein